MRADAKRGVTIHILQVFQCELMLCVAVLLLFSPWSKLHLLWVMPVTFLGAFLGFGLFSIPLLGTILRLITLRFARALFVGVGANVAGVPYGK